MTSDNGRPNPIVQVRNVIKRFPVGDGEVTVLRGVSLDIYPGEFVSLVGPSGNGKSTLLNMITGIDHPSEGEVIVTGQSVHMMSENELSVWRGEHLGIIFQFFQLLPALSLIKNVMLPMDLVKKVPKRERPERAMTLLDMVGLADQAHKLPSQVSGGQQQRAAIARSLAVEPRAILFDEPTSALDPELVGEVLAVIRDLAAEGRTMIIVTHEMKFAREVASHVIYLYNGQIEEEGPPDRLFGAPRSDRLKQFLKSVG